MSIKINSFVLTKINNSHKKLLNLKALQFSKQKYIFWKKIKEFLTTNVKLIYV